MVRRSPRRTRTDPDSPSTPEASAVVGQVPVVQNELDNLQAQFDQLKAQVRQAQQLAGLGVAAPMIAHEFNNLLTPVEAYAQHALDAGDEQLMRKALSVTLKHVGMLKRMSSQVLKIGAAATPQRQSVAVKTCVLGAAESQCRDFAKDGIRFAVKVDDDLVVWADSLQLEQVLFNLFLNARSAMKSSHNGSLTVTGSREGTHTVIELRDTGPGIAADLLPHIFDPLQTSKTPEANGRQRCAGLGLALCRELIEENGGSISVASKPGVGTTFTITLPTTELSSATI